MNPTSRYYISDILKLVGAPRPVVFNFTGMSDSFLLHLNKDDDVEK